MISIDKVVKKTCTLFTCSKTFEQYSSYSKCISSYRQRRKKVLCYMKQNGKIPIPKTPLSNTINQFSVGAPHILRK